MKKSSNSIQKNIYKEKYSSVDVNTIASTKETLEFLKMLNKLKFEKKASILDLGGGFGTVGLAIRNSDLNARYSYTNYEMSAEGVAFGKSLGLDCREGEIPESGKLPFRKGSYDVIHCSQVIEHLVNPDILFHEAARILKPGGYLFIGTPNIASWLGRLMILFGWQGYGQEVSTEYPLAGKGPLAKVMHGKGGVGFHLRVFSFSGLKDLFKYHQFRIVKKGGAPNFTFKKISSFNSLLYNGAALLDRVFSLRGSLATDIYCLARKPEIKEK